MFCVGVDYVQQAMGGGDQSNESAVEQAKDEQISDFIRGQYKSNTGKEFPIEDKERWDLSGTWLLICATEKYQYP